MYIVVVFCAGLPAGAPITLCWLLSAGQCRHFGSMRTGPGQYFNNNQESVAFKSSVADPDPGSGIWCLFDPGICDGLKIRIRDEQPESYL